MVSNIANIKRTLHRGLALTQKESWNLYDYIQTLEEQQPFINMPCISEGICREDKMQVLDKIRAEIEALTDGVEPERIWNVDVLAIIDKYKAESEEEK